MPPRKRAAARRVVAPTPLDALPLPLALRMFALLPADARLLAAAVCRSCRGMLADPALWTRLDLSEKSGVANPSYALFRAAAARAGGQLEVLLMPLVDTQTQGELMPVLAANAGTMRELVLDTVNANALAALLRAAPGLRVLKTRTTFMNADVLPMLRKEAPFGPLRLTSVVIFVADNPQSLTWRAVIDGLPAHTSLKHVMLMSWPEVQAESDELVGVLLSLQLLDTLTLFKPPASVLARLLGCRALTFLRVYGGGLSLLDAQASAALCDALRANTQLDEFQLSHVDFWHNVDAAVEVLRTLQVHPSLQTVDLSQNAVSPEHAAAAGAAIGALITHSSTLIYLTITTCALGDAGMAPIMDALSCSRHLAVLECSDNGMSEAFARERLLPAVRSCLSLLILELVDVNGVDSPAVLEAQLLLEQRH